MQTFVIRFTEKGSEPKATHKPGSSVISALNFFHKEMQLAKNLKPEDYHIISIGLYYNDDSTGRAKGNWRESLFDLPKTPNPDVKLHLKKIEEESTTTMPFYDEVYKEPQ